MKVGDKIRIILMDGEPRYSGVEGIITHIDDRGQLHGTWGGCAVLPECDTFKVIRDPKEYRKERYKRRKEAHQCVRCGIIMPKDYTKARCPECIKKDNAYLKEYYKGKCRMCCRELPPDYNYVLCKKCRIKISQERYEKKQRKEDEGK